jgi:hypothetical protein
MYTRFMNRSDESAVEQCQPSPPRQILQVGGVRAESGGVHGFHRLETPPG